MYDVLIIGGGPAGITAAIYCARSNLKVALIDKGLIGGNPLNYLEIQNYPGLPGTTENLVDKFLEHLNQYDNIEQFQFEEIEYIDLDNKVVKTVDNEFTGKKIIIATGSKPKMLNVPGETKFIGKGVHYCAICDGPLYKGKNVAVIGGGNSACEEALGLAKICEHVYIIEYTDKLNAEQTTIDQINNTENITVRLNTKVNEIFGKEKVEGLNYSNVNGTLKVDLFVEGVFVYIGMSPNLPHLKYKKWNIGNLDEHFDTLGYLTTDLGKENCETKWPGVYAIGDIRSKRYRQVITAMSDGAIAAIHISKNI